jgi:tetratricopeptide (TPR) repeat protein
MRTRATPAADPAFPKRPPTTRARTPRWLAQAVLGAVFLAALAGGLRAVWREDPDAVWSQAQAQLKGGRIDEAERLAKRLARLRKPKVVDLFLQAQVAIARQRDDQALEVLARIPRDHVLAPQAHLMAGQIELRRNRLRFAERSFLQAIELDPRLVAAHRELIYIYGYQLRRRELGRAFERLAGLTDLTFDNAFLWCLLRSAVWDAGTVILDLSRFLEADPEDRWTRLALAENYCRTGLRDEARTVLEPLPLSDPDALALRVMLALDQQQLEEARRLLDSGPADHPVLARLRGRLALAEHDNHAAARHFRVALAGDPDNRDAILGLINALTRLHDDEAAAPLRRVAEDLDRLNTLIQRAATPYERNNPRLLRDLGAACARLGRFPEARAWYQLAIAQDPLDTESQQALFRIPAPAPPLSPRAAESSTKPPPDTPNFGFVRAPRGPAE